MRLTHLQQYLKGYIISKKLTLPPVIIGGCERSGTTLLQSIVSAHPAIFTIEGETWAFCYGAAANFKGNRPIRIMRLYKALGRQSFPNHCTRWCEKSPANVFYFDAILKYFSNNIKLIHIVRDGRDVVTSMHPSNPSKPWVSVERWVQAVEKGYQYRDYAQVLTIKYEDLIMNFSNSAELICEHIGVDFENRLLDWHRYATIKSSRNLIGSTVKDLSNRSIRKFETDDFKHKKIIEEFMRNKRAVRFLELYGYI